MILPVALLAQDLNQPYVKFDNDAILFYLPSGSAYAPSLPVYKPGFVHILRTTGFQIQSIQELSEHLACGIRDLLSSTMTPTQKTEFLEQYACLVLLNYIRISELDTLFYTKAVALQEDSNPEIKANASLVVKMVDLYREK